MKKVILAVTLPVALASCASHTLDTEVVPAASFAPLEKPSRVFASPNQIVAHYLAPLGLDEPSEMEFGNYPGGSGDRLLLFSVEGLEDDSVRAQQWRILLDQTDVGLRVISAGLRQKCYRNGTDEWTTALCP